MYKLVKSSSASNIEIFVKQQHLYILIKMSKIYFKNQKLAF
jgi:hypothetical protein